MYRNFTVVEQDANEIDSLYVFLTSESQDPITQSNIIIEQCGDIMDCHCEYNLTNLFKSTDKSVKNGKLFWKEGVIIAETFNCEIRLVDLLVVNRTTCIKHTGGIVKKLKNKNSWNNELSIYQLPGLQHENILVFLDAYHHSSGAFPYSIITAEAKIGSLYSHLMRNPWTDFHSCLSVLVGIVQGVAHLHSTSRLPKPAIVHRDLKSKNILLKHDLTPCIADFGLAANVVGNNRAFKEFPINTVRVGTQRYMAPEILEGTININLLSYMSSDVYALSLVMWEVLSQCPKFDNDLITPIFYDPMYTVPQYCLPFTAELKNEMPTMEKMTHIVCEKKLRLRPQAWWILNETVRCIWTTIQDCWEEIPEERISASLVLERLKTISINETEQIL